MNDNLLINLRLFKQHVLLLFLAAPRSLQSTKATGRFNWPRTAFLASFFLSRKKRALTSPERLGWKIVSSRGPGNDSYLHTFGT